jgi:hypothetical protein
MSTKLLNTLTVLLQDIYQQLVKKEKGASGKYTVRNQFGIILLTYVTPFVVSPFSLRLVPPRRLSNAPP